MKKASYSILLLALCLLFANCKKYLSEKPDGHLEIPESISDFQALIDYYPTINNSDPSSGEISADNYYLFTSDFLSMSQDIFRNMYTWNKTNLFAPQSNEWFYVYRPVFTANTVLEGLKKLDPNSSQYSNVKGQALFIRAKAFYLAVTLWSLAYDPAISQTDLGIPIRLQSDFNQQSTRATVQKSYDQIIGDLKASLKLLPVTPVSVTRASRPAAYAMIAKTYLAMRKYDQAVLYADSCLQLNSVLLDYSMQNGTKSYPFPRFNAEVIYESLIGPQEPVTNTRARIDTDLYRSYSVNDLRKSLFFKSSTNGSVVFRGSYEGKSALFGGIATDEVLLMRAECMARAGKIQDAMNDLNALLVKRYKAGTFSPLAAADIQTALYLILTERRKELIMRGIRWIDIKRLNKEGGNVTLTRNVNGQTFTLPPNDPRYALPIPDDIISITGMQQNPR